MFYYLPIFFFSLFDFLFNFPHACEWIKDTPDMPDDHIPGYSPLGTAVIGIVPVVTQYKIVISRDYARTIVVQPAAPIIILNIWFFIKFIINEQIAVPYFHLIARKTDHSFHKIGITATWVSADDNIETLRISSGCYPCCTFLCLCILPRKG